MEKTAVIFILKFLAEVLWHKVSRLVVCRYQKQHVHSWAEVHNYFCGTGSGSWSACLISRKPLWPGDVTRYLPKKWTEWAHLGDRKSEGVVGVGLPFWAAAAIRLHIFLIKTHTLLSSFASAGESMCGHIGDISNLRGLWPPLTKGLIRLSQPCMSVNGGGSPSCLCSCSSPSLFSSITRCSHLPACGCPPTAMFHGFPYTIGVQPLQVYLWQ